MPEAGTLPEERSDRIVITLTPGSLTQGYILLTGHLSFFPEDAIGGANRQFDEGKQLTLRFEGFPDEPIETDIDGAKYIFRRGGLPIRRFFDRHGLQAGDQIVIVKRSKYNYDIVRDDAGAASGPLDQPDAGAVGHRRYRRGRTDLDARSLLEPLVGQQISTVSGRPNAVIGLTDVDVVVGTDRSPDGELVPIEAVQSGLDRLLEAGEIEVHPRSLGYRSSFVGAALLTLPGAVVLPGSPPRIRLADPLTAYRAKEAGHVNEWWAGDPRQRFWLEITDRRDIGVDLHCPQRDAEGNRTPGYSLIWWVQIDDIVFHYDRNAHAVTAWSRAAGPVTEAPTVWLSHRATTRRRLLQKRAQPGWWLDLDGPFPVDPPLTLTQIRQSAPALRTLLDTLRSDHPGSLYFPFSFYGGTEPRPQQPYLNKLPVEFVEFFPPLSEAAELTSPGEAHQGDVTTPLLGTVYRQAQVSPLPTEREPFTVDPALVERGLRGHADTQNELAQVLRQAGIEPRSRHSREPNFDLAWEKEGTVFVAEVKSITNDNEEQQLRLGLGQVLRYRQRLGGLGYQRVVAVLVPERAPRDSSWRDLCHDLGLVLLTRNEIDQAPQLS